MSDTTEQPVNGTAPGEDLAALYQQAATAYAQNFTRMVHEQSQGQVDPIPLLVELNVLRMKFNILLSAIAHSAATGEKFDMQRFDRAVIATLAHNAQALARPKIVVANDAAPFRRQ